VDVTRRDRLAALGQWLLLGSLVGVLCGAASALFLWLLDGATEFRDGDERIVYALPIAGLVIGWVYERFGQAIKAGNNLVIDTIHDEGPEIPLRMAPMVLIGTVLTHVFGGSAGREGTAVQMGASITDWVSHRLRVGRQVRLQLLAAGVAGGFGSVFGTPVAGAVFGLEFIVLGRIEYGALVPALVASVVGDMTTRALGIVHTHYPTVPHVALTPVLVLKWMVFAAAVAGVTTAFIELTHLIKRRGELHVPRLPVRMFLGGITVVGLWQLVGTSDYLGLGVPMIVRAFEDPSLPVYAFALKLIFTAVTLGAGFLGGEVTPLFFVGATLGSVLARLLGIPIELGAGVGLGAVFAAASNTPLALSIMAVELLGAALFPHVAIVCVLAYLLAGHRSIYPSQRILNGKAGTRLSRPTPLRDLSSPSDPVPTSSTLHAKMEEMRSALLSAVSHDLRTPIASITGAATALRDDPDLDIRTRDELVEAVIDQAGRLERLVANLLDMTRLESGGIALKRDWVPLDEMVGSALTRLEARLGERKVAVDIPDDVPLLFVDPVLMEQLFVNLLENADNHTPPGSSLEIRARSDGDRVRIDILDHGIGFAPDMEERVFEKFVRGSASGAAGAGLGLPICRGIVEAHGGSIWAENRSDGGAILHVVVPHAGTPPFFDPPSVDEI